MLFLAVLLAIVGWGRSPLAAAVISVLPLAALLGTRAPGGLAPRAIVGCAFVGSGVLCLAFLPLDTVALIDHEHARAYADRYEIEESSLADVLSARGAGGSIFEFLERVLRP